MLSSTAATLIPAIQGELYFWCALLPGEIVFDTPALMATTLEKSLDLNEKDLLALH